MKRSTLVFSLVKEQSIFMTAVVTVLTFLSVLAFGIALSIGTGVIRWNSEWNKYATIQIINPDNSASVKKILKKSADIKILKEQIAPKAKFLTHSSALQSSIAAGWKLFGITAFVLVLILVSIGVCISYISRNIAMLHKHELEILNQVGATDKFIARQMQIIVAKISCIAAFIGFVAATPIIAVILSTAHSARIGLLATLTLSGTDIFALLLLPVLIVVFSVYITKKTTIKILSEN